MHSGLGNRVALVILALAVCAAIGVAGLRADPSAGQSGCASLGQAADFAVFSDGAFNASESSGTSISGRIAAAGDVTLDGASVGPASGDASPTIVAGRNFTAGRTTGAGGTVNGGVTYGGTSNVAQNFTVNGGLTQAAPPFSFDTEFTSIKTLSASLADLPQSPGASVSLAYGALTLTGTGSGLNVFTVDAAQLAQAAGIVINLTQPGATGLINVNTATILSIAPQYMNLSGSATAAGILWNLPLATEFDVTHGVAWQGTILAPNANVTGLNHPQLNGQLIAASVPDSSWVINRVTYTGCLPQPPGPPDTTLTMQALCIDANGALDMRLRNTGDQTRDVSWVDLTRRDAGTFAVPAHSDFYFYDRGGDGSSVVRATSGTTTIQANGTDARCQGQITVQLVTEGDAPAGQTWDVHLTNGDNGNVSDVLTLGSGQSATTTVPGGYVGGAAAVDEVVGGAAYTISVDDSHGALSTSISLNPVEILDGQNEFVTVTLVYESGTPGTGPPVEPEAPVDPTLPPGAPDPPPGPGLDNGNSGTDLAITHQIIPSRVRVGGTIQTVSRITNLGPAAAVGVVAREIPQFHPETANSVAHVLSLTASEGTCTQRRPVRCSLGTLAPGATVTIRTRTRVLVVAALRSIVVVSSDTPDTNMTNNLAEANVRTFSNATVQAKVSAPASGRVAAPLSYRVFATLRRGSPASAVRLCTTPPHSFVQIHAPGTFKYQGVYCRNFALVRAGRSVSFLVSAFPSATGRVTPSVRATAVGAARESRASADIVVGAPAACPASARPLAHAAC
ncbi:MAG TPA: choice-of-anchor A family protein [Solirubrobacteraceae bacterium]|nr:choice-of-anchor A family protein [Solirubrobacteraceae bacterium]